MAEIIGPLGLCFGGLSFILGTVPTAAKFLTTYQEYKQQTRGIEKRLALCQARFCEWEVHWQKSNLGDRSESLQSSLSDIQDLHDDINKAISDSTAADTTEALAWQKMKDRLRRGVFRKPRMEADDFCSGLRHALWKRELLEGWMTRLEKAVDTVEKLFDKDIRVRTAGYLSRGENTSQVKKLEQLESSAGTLMSLATEIYGEGTGVAQSYAWALGLRTPATGDSILDWEVPTPVNIELRFSIKRKDEESGHYHLHVRYQDDNPETHKCNGMIERLVRARTSGKGKGIRDGTLGSTKCRGQDAATRRTFPIGSLLETKPHLFKERAWRVDRAELVYGICEWALRLWDTPWFERLCCHSLLVEIGTQSAGCARHIFDNDKHSRCRPDDHKSKLRNLGITLAQLILGISIRPASGDNPSKFERWIDVNSWEPIFRSEINSEIILTTSSKHLQEAIDFCLKPDSLLPEGTFQPGYLFPLMEHIYKP